MPSQNPRKRPAPGAVPVQQDPQHLQCRINLQDVQQIHSLYQEAHDPTIPPATPIRGWTWVMIMLMFKAFMRVLMRMIMLKSWNKRPLLPKEKRKQSENRSH